MKVRVMSPIERLRTVAFMSTLVSVGLIGMSEFVTAMSLIEEAVLEDDNVSESFLLCLSEGFSRGNK